MVIDGTRTSRWAWSRCPGSRGGWPARSPRDGGQAAALQRASSILTPEEDTQELQQRCLLLVVSSGCGQETPSVKPVLKCCQTVKVKTQTAPPRAVVLGYSAGSHLFRGLERPVEVPRGAAVHWVGLCTWGDPPQNWNYLLEGGPLIVQAFPLGECSRNPSGSVHQLVLL